MKFEGRNMRGRFLGGSMNSRKEKRGEYQAQSEGIRVAIKKKRDGPVLRELAVATKVSG